MTDYVKCVVGNCFSRVPTWAPPVCQQHLPEVEPGICVDAGGGRRFIPATDPECAESFGEPLLRPRRAVRWKRAVHEFGQPTA